MTGDALTSMPEPLRDRMARLSPEKRALLERRLAKRGRTDRPAPAPRLVRHADTDAPLSLQQERFWLQHRLEASSAFNDRMALRLRGPLVLAALEADLGEIVRRHETLRTRFPECDGVPVQRVEPAVPVRLPAVDLTALDDRDLMRTGQELATEVGLRVPDLERERPLAMSLLRLGPEDHVLAISMHHIASDGWSWGIFLRELDALSATTRAGKPSALEEPPVSYGDYARWQRELMSGERARKLLDYWTEQLAGMPSVLDLPTDRPRPALQGFDGAVHPLWLPAATANRLRRVGQERSATLFMVLLAGFQALLARLSGTDDVVVGVPALGRDRKELEQLIGVFINNLVLRTDLSGDPTFDELLARVRRTALGAFSHQDLPFQRLVESLEVERSLAHAPLFQVMFDFQPGVRQEAPLGSVDVGSLPLSVTTTRFDLVLNAEERSDGAVGGGIQYRRDLFDATTVERIARRFVQLLERIAGAPHRRVSSLSSLSSVERHQLVTEWGGPRESGPERLEVPGSVVASALAGPDAVALEGAGWALGYGELERRSRRLAARLVDLGVTLETPVGVCIERGPDLVVALLAVLRSGGAYVPLDPEYPRERLESVLADSGARVVLTGEEAPPGLAPGRPVQVEGVRPAVPVSERAAAAVDRPAPPEAPAYLIYTSGSTGRPKGVIVPRGALANFLGSMARRPGMAPEDVLLAVTTVSFDIAGLELWLPLALGARLVVAGAQEQGDGAVLSSWIERRRVTLMQATPATWRLLLEGGWPAREGPPAGGPGLRVLSGGEALPRELASELLAQAGEVWNLYGPTETTVWSGATRVRDEDGPVAIGESVAHTRLAVVDSRAWPVATAVPGELWIGGAGVARGYRGRPGLTAERFVPDPFSERAGARAYRTGDLVRWRRDGRLEYLGRLDHQVKVRGFRIELGEIETALARHAGVRQAVAGVQEGPTEVDRRLVAWVVPADGAEAPARDGLRAHLRESLPEYMVPSLFVTLDELPLTPNGKIDRRALPQPSAPTGGEGSVEPRTPLEAVLAQIWGRVLDLPRVGVRDDFFELGGHSLLATRMVARIRRATDVELPLSTVFEHPTVAGLAAEVERLRADGAPRLPAVEARGKGGRAPLSYSQERLWFLHRLDPESPAYNLGVALELSGRLCDAALGQVLTELTRRHPALRTRIEESGGRAEQVLLAPEPMVPQAVDLSGLPAAAVADETARLAVAAFRRPFDLSAGRCLRLVSLRLGARTHRALLTTHHAFSDGVSLRVVVEELTELYRAFVTGEPAALPAPPVDYGDFALWQREWIRGELLHDQVAYWKSRLEGIPETLELPLDRPRPSVQRFRGARLDFRLGPELSRRLAALSRQWDGTLFMTLLGAFQVLLHVHSDRRDIVVGTPVSYRNWPEIERVVGFFSNILVLRTDLSGDPSFAQLVGRVRQGVLSAFSHQDVPFHRLLGELGVARNLRHNPLFQVTFTFQSDEEGEDAFELPGLEIRRWPVEDGTTQFDLNLTVAELPDGLGGTLRYNRDLFEHETVSGMVHDLEHILTFVADREDAPIGEIRRSVDAVAAKRRRRLEEELAGKSRARFQKIARRKAQAR